MNRIGFPAALALASCAALVALPRPTHACGGCFHGASQSAPTVVTGHRMALSISTTRTVLWDQVQYAGDPKEFAWVLPVGKGATIEASNDAWFESLEAVTSTHILSKAIVCNGTSVSQGEAAGCGASPGFTPTSLDSASEPTRQGDVAGVTVEHEGTVGPYDTVTLASTDPQALRTWLLGHDYEIPAEIDPVIDAYVSAGFDFIALRLQPGEGIRQMTPVRVVTPGASPTLPLRMVAAGAGTGVEIVLYVIGEGRYDVQNFPTSSIDFSTLTWDWSLSSSNYADVRNQTLSDGSFLTTFAHAGGFTATIDDTQGTATFNVANYAPETNLADLYFAQSASNDGNSGSCSGITDVLLSNNPVVDTCVNGTCATAPAGAIAANSLACDGHDDLSAAMIGMHPASVWVTRLEAELPYASLANDLELQAAAQTEVPNWHVAPIDLNPPCNPNQAQTAPAPSSSTQSGCSTLAGRTPGSMLAGTFAAAILLAARRMRKRGKRRPSRTIR